VVASKTAQFGIPEVKRGLVAAGGGPLAVATTKEIIVKAPGWTEDEMWQKQVDMIVPVFMSNDAKEGAVAFAEKRAPQWTGV
jgi:enoyl-CoA hydratase